MTARPYRWLHFGPLAGTIAHHGFEVAAGVGLVFQPYLGTPGSVAGWGIALPAWGLLARRARGRPADDALALLAGLSLAGTVVHFALWPVSRRPAGRWWALPALTAAEGLSAGQLPAYNAILYLWGLSTATALLFGTPARSRRWAVVGMAAAVPFRASARHHFEWLKEQAAARPAWWNRAGAQRSGADDPA